MSFYNILNILSYFQTVFHVLVRLKTKMKYIGYIWQKFVLFFLLLLQRAKQNNINQNDSAIDIKMMNKQNIIII